jgi:hypothetical protein
MVSQEQEGCRTHCSKDQTGEGSIQSGTRRHWSPFFSKGSEPRSAGAQSLGPFLRPMNSQAAQAIPPIRPPAT